MKQRKPRAKKTMVRIVVDKVSSPKERRDAANFLTGEAVRIRYGQTTDKKFTAALKYY